MKLADFMHEQQITPWALRRMLGVKGQSTVQRYLSGERVPSPALMRRIHELSDGRVTVEDFLDPEPPRCARVVIDRRGRPRMVFPWTELDAVPRSAQNENRTQPRKRHVPGKPLDPPERSGRLDPGEDPDDWPYGPLRHALEELGPRAMQSKRGHFLLDGRVTDPKRLVAAANRERTRRGESPIPYPGVDPL